MKRTAIVVALLAVAAAFADLKVGTTNTISAAAIPGSFPVAVSTSSSVVVPTFRSALYRSFANPYSRE